MNIAELHKLFLKSTGVSTDTRNLIKGQLFFCLRGEHFNGNKFVNDALEKEAIAVIVDDEKYVVSKDKTIYVEDSLKALQALAKYHRSQFDIPLIGLTGSNGKTTTKELIHAVLKQKYVVHATDGNFNNHIGVPLTLLGISSTTEIALIEMGANHQKEIAFLCDIAAPTLGYITNFGKAHLEGFGGIEGVIKGKSELYDFLRATDGIALINGNDPLQIKQAEGVEQIIFGKEDSHSIVIKNTLDDSGFCVTEIDNTSIPSHLTGAYNFDNINAALSFGKYFKINAEELSKGIDSYHPTNNRSQWIEGRNNKILLDAYNANPSSTKAALSAFNLLNSDKKIVLLGDMLELGEFAKKEHQAIVNLTQEFDFDRVLLVGKNYHECQHSKEMVAFKTVEDLKNYLSDHLFTGATILIKGSRGIALEQLLDHF